MRWQTESGATVVIGDQLDALFHAGVFPPEMAAAEAATLAWEQRPIVLAPTLVEQILASPKDLAALKLALGL